MKTTYLQHWKFTLADKLEKGPTNRPSWPDPWTPSYDDGDWEEVMIPHDWAVSFPFSREYSSGTGYLCGGTGWYRTVFSVPTAGEKVFVNFDGVYKHSQVWCNGYYLGERASGYSSFRYDISHCVHPGEDNVIAVKVSHEDIADSRWYTGSGVYRKVSLDFHGPVYIPGDRIVVRTDLSGTNADSSAANARTDGAAAVHISCAVKADRAATAILVTAQLTGKDGAVYRGEARLAKTEPGTPSPITLEIEVPQPDLWSPENPNRYTLALELTAKNEDGGECRFTAAPIRIGIRSIKFDPDKGFFINGVSQKIKGVCVHHDAGALGAAVWPDVWRRRLEKLKAAGCNAIRMSHNPHMGELYDLCDELGFYVMDEAFDEWEGCKNKWFHGHNVYPPVHQGYSADFPQWYERDTADMVIRGRNHPSIIFWSIGNEIDYPNDPYVHPLFAEMTGNNDANKPKAEQVYNPQKPNMERLPVIAAELAAIVKQHDPTRPVLTAAAFPELSGRLGFFDALDMAGYNYKEQFYEADHRHFPTLPLIGSENGHHLAAWKAVRDTEYISGQFLWTGIDYLGEAHRWPIRGSGAGLLDIAGNEKIAYFRRKTFWTDEPVLYLATRPKASNTKVIDIQPWELYRSWNYQPGTTIEVVCYTNLPKAELFCNGTSLGVHDREADREYIAWTVPFARGTLEVSAVGVSGETVRDAVESTLPAVRIGLRLWKPGTAAACHRTVGAYRLNQVEVELLDEAGRLCTGESPLLEVTVSGGGKLAGIENGDLSDCMAYAEPRRHAYRGRLIVYVLTEAAAKEKTTLAVSAEGIGGAEIFV
ncbi:beta-galactosidase [Spirochaetia bacterium]|nr:beta-galactosidase [Spirochaetia bacterium]